MTLYKNFTSAPWHEDRSAYIDSYNAAFMHWFLIVLACGGASVTTSTGNPCFGAVR